MLSENEYLDIAERVERFSIGDFRVYAATPGVLLTDLVRLLSDWREWQRKLEQARQSDPADQAADDQR